MNVDIVGKRIRDAMIGENMPLTDDQYMLMQGYLAMFIIMSKTNGVESVLSNLEKNKKEAKS